MTQIKRRKRAGAVGAPKVDAALQANPDEQLVVERTSSPLIPMLWVLGPLVLLAIYGACS